MSTQVQNQQQEKREVPERILAPLRQVAGRQRILSVARAILQALALALLAWLGVVWVLGSYPQMPVAVRMTLAGAAWLMLVVALIYYLWPTFHHYTLNAAAQRIEQAQPEVQERLSSAVEIAVEKDERFRGSPQLVDHLLHQAEADAQNVDPVAVIPAHHTMRWMIAGLVVCLLWLIVAAMFTSTIFSGLRQTFVPWDNPPTLPGAQLVLSPDQDTDAAQGDKLNLTAEMVLPENDTAKRDANQTLSQATLICKYPSGQSVATPMDRTGAMSFRYTLDNLQQNFTYRISTPVGDSRTYRVAVSPRPAVKGVDVQYTYPAYTALGEKTIKDKDGSIEALVGTKVKLTIHATQKVTEKSRLVVDDNTPDRTVLPLTATGVGNDYTAALTVARNGQYRIELFTPAPQELANRDNQPRPIIARQDQPPQVAITAPPSTLKIRPDDQVAVVYNAEDDFGLTKVEALVQVDQLPTQTIALPLTGSPLALTKEQWMLSVPEQLKLAHATTAQRITYQLRVTDNCQPKANVSLSAKQVLEIDQGVESVATRKDNAEAKDLAEAVKKAQERLEAVQKNNEALQQAARDRNLTEAEKQNAENIKQELTKTIEELRNAAEKSQEGAFKDQAKAVQETADKPLTEAAREIGQAQLASDQPTTRQENLRQAQEQTRQAREQLERLNKEISDQANRQRLTHQLEDVAKRQQEIAQHMAQPNANNKEQTLQQQREVQKQTEQIIRENPELQKPVSRVEQERIKDIANKIDQIAQSQKAVNEQVQNKVDAAQAKEKLNQLAGEQKKLNDEINEFARNQQERLKNAGAQPPDPAKLDPIVKDLQNQKLSNAQQAQNAAAKNLEQVGERMDQVQKRQQENAARTQEKATQAAQEAQDTKELNQQTEQLGKDIADAVKEKRPPTRPSDPANRQAQELAQKIQKEANELASQSPQKKAAVEEAKKAAAEAQAAAKQGQAQEAQQKLSQAASKLDEAAQQAARETQAAAKDDPAQNAQTGKQAKELAQKQEKLAEKTTQMDKALRDAQEKSTQPQTLEKEQQRLSEQMEQTSRQAKELRDEAKGSAPQLSQQASEASEAMKQAAQKQSESSQQKGDPQRANQAQQESTKQISRAQDALRGMQQMSQSKPQNDSSSPEKPNGQPNSNSTPSQDMNQTAESVQRAHRAQENAAQGDASAAARAAEALTQASRSLAQSSSAESKANPSGQAANTPSAGQPSPNSAKTGTAKSNGAAKGDGSKEGSGSSPTGVQITAAPSEDTRPEAVKTIGIPPSDWAKLQPQMQQQLLNAAQQKGPPAYQEMIKNYYLRIARLEAQNPGEPR